MFEIKESLSFSQFPVLLDSVKQHLSAASWHQLGDVGRCCESEGGLIWSGSMHVALTGVSREVTGKAFALSSSKRLCFLVVCEA